MSYRRPHCSGNRRTLATSLWLRPGHAICLLDSQPSGYARGSSYEVLRGPCLKSGACSGRPLLLSSLTSHSTSLRVGARLTTFRESSEAEMGLDGALLSLRAVAIMTLGPRLDHRGQRQRSTKRWKPTLGVSNESIARPGLDPCPNQITANGRHVLG